MKNKFTKNQEKWLSLLESGKIKQGRDGFLRDSHDKYCCLGVIQECILGKKGKLDRDGGHYCYKSFRGGMNSALPKTSSISLKLNDCVDSGSLGYIKEEYLDSFCNMMRKINGKKSFETADSLANFNDGGATFKQIAKGIRRMPYAVFTNFDESYKSK